MYSEAHTSYEACYANHICRMLKALRNQKMKVDKNILVY